MKKKEEMRSYEFGKELAGEWLVVSDDKVIAHSDDLGYILEFAGKYNKKKEIIVTKAIAGQACFF